MFSRPDLIKKGNDVIVAAFQQRLKSVARFTFAPAPPAMKNSTDADVYYLFFTSQKPAAEKIIEHIFRTYRA